MNQKTKLFHCVWVNMMLLGVIVFLVFTFNDGSSPYFRLGPQEDLVLISVKINTWERYFVLLLLQILIKVCNVIVAEIANPILGFTIYNPDKKDVFGFDKTELQAYANLMFFVDNCKYTLMFLFSISQIDIAFFGIIVSEITGIFTVRMLLNEKTFHPEKDADEDADEDAEKKGLLEVV